MLIVFENVIFISFFVTGSVMIKWKMITSVTVYKMF